MNKKNIIAGIIVLVLLGITSLLIYTSRAFYEVSDSFNFINSRYYEQTIFDFSYTESSQLFTVPKDGYYKIEAWGASGGVDAVGTSGGKGAYTTGTIYLTKGEKLYIYVGNSNNDFASNYNGGTVGQGVDFAGWNRGSGGGATDIRLISGEWNDSSSLRSRIMVASGGGGAVDYGVNFHQGASGGALISELSYYMGFATTDPVAGSKNVGATQINGGSTNTDNYSQTIYLHPGTFGQGALIDTDIFATTLANMNGGTGGGYYGGVLYHTGSRVYTGGGGSSYISGYAGVNSVLESGGTAIQPLHTNDTIHYSNKYFINPTMKSGIEQMPDSTGGTMTGNEGNGKAKISYLGNTTPEKTNTTLNNVRYVKDCVNGTSANVGDYWVEIQAMVNGVNIAKSKPVTGSVVQNNSYPYSRITDGDITSANYSASSVYGLQCVTVDLGQTYNLDEVAVWHYYADGRSSYHNYLSVGSANVSGTTSLSTVLINNQTVMDTSQGQRFTAWD